MSTDLPWRSERELDAARVARIVDAQFARLAPSSARYLAEGWDSEAYLVNDAWILRFPKRREVEASQDIERELLPRLAPVLPLPIPVPALLGERCEEFPFRFLGYARLEGEPAESFPLERLNVPRCAEAVGSFLSRVHSFPVDVARALGVPERPPWDRAALGARFRERWPDVAPALPGKLAERAERFFAAGPPPPAPSEPRLVHGDLLSEHVLVRADGCVAGVIDWGDVALGDPASDVAGLIAWLGPPFAEAVLERYGGEPDPGFLVRAGWRAAWASLMIAWAGVRRSSALDLEVGRRGLDLALPA